MKSPRHKRDLLLAFDAFGTLFTPRQPVPTQYGNIARRHGLSGFTDDDIARSFRTAFMAESKSHPNYGRETDMKAQTWWANVIMKTFQPIVSKNSDVPATMIQELLARFSTDDGYRMYPDVLPFFQYLRECRRTPSKCYWNNVIVGIITNSDDRVPSILESLGLTVGPRRIGTATEGHAPASTNNDVAFVVLSYDVGVQKPDRRIFEAAERLFYECLPSVSSFSAPVEISDFVKLYVGDELEKDTLAALNAGWNGIFVDRNGVFEETRGGGVNTIQVPNGTDRTVEAISTLEALKDWKPRDNG